MKRKIKIIYLALLIVAQVLLWRNYPTFRFNIDFLYLIIVYLAIRSSFLTSILAATCLGIIADYFSGGVMGVFAFSRTLTTYLLTIASRFVDLRKNFFIFMMILISLFLSNLMANIFFYFIFNFHITVNLLFIQPLLTALIGTVMVGLNPVKELLDVY